MSVGIQELAALQSETANIRNVCILAHVDHGKTTLSDSLIASNGVISTKQAGKLRYMDSLPAEQERDITMKSSSISLVHKRVDKNGGEGVEKTLLINVIDSPGHVDFSSEVSSALQISDGALIIVDAVEGVCIQTLAVLRQAWKGAIKPVLVINKIERLITHLELSPAEAYQHIKRILEQINAAVAHLWHEGRANGEGDVWNMCGGSDTDGCDLDQEGSTDEIEEMDADDGEGGQCAFSPEKGNVVFSSATDCWGFTIDDFARFYSKKLGMKEAALRRALWGEYYFKPKEKRVVTAKHARPNDVTMFVKFVLENIWAVYDAVMVNRDGDRISKIVKSLSLTIPPRELKVKDSKSVVQSIMSRWLPLSTTVLDMIADELPSPKEAQRKRVRSMWPQLAKPLSDTTRDENRKVIYEAVRDCNPSEDAPCTVFVSKLFPLPLGTSISSAFGVLSVNEGPVAKARSRIDAFDKMKAARRREEIIKARAETVSVGVDSKKKEGEGGVEVKVEIRESVPMPMPIVDDKEDKDEDKGEDEEDAISPPPPAITSAEETFIGFARVFSGTLRRGMKINVLLPRYNPNSPHIRHRSVFDISDLYMLMGRSIEPLESFSAGSILGIGGSITDHILKTGTLCSSIDCPPFPIMTSASRPVIRVAIEPEKAQDIEQLKHGLQLLVHSDPCVESFVQESGEHVILAAGEVHLDRCIRDLKDRFAKVPFVVSSPMSNFRETIIEVTNEQQQQSGSGSGSGNNATSSSSSSSASSSIKTAKKIEVAQVSTPDKLVTLSVKAVPLPEKITNYLESQSQSQMDSSNSGDDGDEYEDNATKDGGGGFSEFHDNDIFWRNLQRIAAECGEVWADRFKRIIALGPKRLQSCWLVNDTGLDIKDFCMFDSHSQSQCESDSSSSTTSIENAIRLRLKSAIVTGFNIATSAGPLCDEPVSGVLFLLKDIQVQVQVGLDEGEGENDIVTSFIAISDSFGPITGQVISTMKECCRLCIENGKNVSLRLREPMLLCEVQTTADYLGKVYGVLNKRRSHILSEELKEGTPYFDLQAHIPAASSFGFTEELRTRTSGAANPQLIFSHWETLKLDPYHKPTTQDEVEEWGQWDLRRNAARDLVLDVRRRKGMQVAEQVVESAEKQRNLSRK